MLKSQILAAVQQAKNALQDLVVSAVHVARVSSEYVPGQTVSFTETSTSVSVVFTKFETREIDEDRIQSSDWRGLVFPEDGLPDFNTNDVIRIAAGLPNLIAGNYRILKDDKILVGDTVALHQLHLRLT